MTHHKLTVSMYKSTMGFDQEEWTEHLEDLAMGGEDCEALCTCGETIEPDGECQHGGVSVLRALGAI